MTENEAIKELETSIDLAKMCTQNYERKSEIQGYEMAIKALEEVQQYRQIGTPEEFRVSVEKQTAKKPYLQPVQKNEYREDECWECPSCDSFLGYEVDCRDDHYRENYCPYCGQKLDWEE